MVSFTPSSLGGKLDLNVGKNIKDLGKLGLGTKPPTGTPPGTVPIGNGFYATPNTPAEPTDCVRWPNSPWCKVGLPDYKKPFYIDVSPKVHSCGFDIEISGAAFYLPLPTNKLSYRYEGDCRKDPPPPPPPPPGGATLHYPQGIDLNGLVFAFVAVDISTQGRVRYQDSRNQWVWVTYNSGSTGMWTGTTCPGGYYTDSNGQRTYAQIRGDWIATSYSSTADPGSLSSGNRTEYFGQGQIATNHGAWETYGIDENGNELWITDASGNTRTAYYQNADGSTYYYSTPQTGILERQRTIGNTFFDGSGASNNNGGCTIYKGTWGNIILNLQSGIRNALPSAIDEPDQQQTATQITHVDSVVMQDCGQPDINPYRNNPPLPPDKKCNCMSSCCPDYTALINELLKEIKKANAAIGSDKWSSSKVPANLLVKDGLSNAQVPIASINEWCEWYSKQFDSLMGRWKIDLEVEHPDPTDPKAKPVKMALPNLAESVAELMGMMIHISMNVDALTNVGTRTLIQSGQASQQAFTNWMLLNAIQEYIGFADEDDVREMVLAFKPNETDLSKLLKETHVKVKGVKFKKDTQRLRDALHDLLRGAAIISAVHWRKLDSNKKNYGQQLFDLISGTAGLVSKIGDPKNKITGDSDFDTFIKDFEEGFIEHTGLDKDLQTNPYGRPYDERPQVKKLGKAPTQNPPQNQ